MSRKSTNLNPKTYQARRLPLALILYLSLAGLLGAGQLGFCGGNDFCLLDDDQAALQARVDLINAATTEISLAYYAIDTGDVPIGLLQLLRQAARRGVCVRVLMDGLKSRLPSDLENLLTRDGVQFRLYHPPLVSKPKWLNRRLHTKLIVADRCAMVIGSRNLQDHHFGLRQRVSIDCDAWVTGDVCQQAAEYFDWLWNSDDVKPAGDTNSLGVDFSDNRSLAIPLGFALTPRRTEAYERAMNRAQLELESILANPKQCSPATCVSNVSASLVHDLTPSKADRLVQRKIVALIDSAATSILLESPYPVFSRVVQAALERAAGRGVLVRLVTNSLQSTNNVLTYAAFQNEKRSLLVSGIEVGCNRHSGLEWQNCYRNRLYQHCLQIAKCSGRFSAAGMM